MINGLSIIRFALLCHKYAVLPLLQNNHNEVSLKFAGKIREVAQVYVTGLIAQYDVIISGVTFGAEATSCVNSVTMNLVHFHHYNCFHVRLPCSCKSCVESAQQCDVADREGSLNFYALNTLPKLLPVF